MYTEYADAYKNIGDVYDELGQTKKARENWSQAAEIYRRKNNCEQYQIVQQQL